MAWLICTDKNLGTCTDKIWEHIFMKFGDIKSGKF